MAKAICTTVTQQRVRAFWMQRHGLRAPVGKRPAAVVARSGWLRTLGGIDAYLALRARAPDITAATLDRSVASGKLSVIPALRGCIYLVPHAHVASLMGLASLLSRPRTERDLDKAGSSWAEVKDAEAGVRSVLASGPKTSDEIRAALPTGAVRSLGARGKKVGLSSVLPTALRQLEFEGRVRRALVGGRLDTERYRWGLVDGEPSREELELATVVAELVQCILGFAGPLTVKELAAFVGVPQREVKAGLQACDAHEVTVQGWPVPGYVRGQDAGALAADDDGAGPVVHMLPANDNLGSIHGGPAPLVDPEHHGIEVKTWGGRGDATPLGSVNHLGMRPIVFGDRIIGIWEFDPDSGRVKYGTFGTPPGGSKTAMAAEATSVASFITGLGHGRPFSLDTDESLRKRVAWIASLPWSK